jgi:hypothetical protein
MLCGCPAATTASPPGSASLLSCSAISARRGPSANASPTRNLIRAGQRRLSRRRAALQKVEDVDGETLITINELQLRSLPPSSSSRPQARRRLSPFTPLVFREYLLYARACYVMFTPSGLENGNITGWVDERE